MVSRGLGHKTCPQSITDGGSYQSRPPPSPEWLDEHDWSSLPTPDQGIWNAPTCTLLYLSFSRKAANLCNSGILESHLGHEYPSPRIRRGHRGDGGRGAPYSGRHLQVCSQSFYPARHAPLLRLPPEENRVPLLQPSDAAGYGLYQPQSVLLGEVVVFITSRACSDICSSAASVKSALILTSSCCGNPTARP